MLANFLNKSKPINLIGLLVFFFFSFLITVFLDFNETVLTIFYILDLFIYLLFFLGIFFFYNFVLSKNKLTLDHSYGFFIFTLIIICFLPKILSLKELSVFLIYTLFLRKVYSLRSNKSVLEKLFDMGFWLGICFLLKPISILFIILIYISVYLFKKTTLQTLFAPIFGFITPLIIYFAYFFFNENTSQFISLFKFTFYFDSVLFFNTKYTLLLLILIVIGVLSIFSKSTIALSVNNSFKKSWLVLISNFVIAVLLLLLDHHKNLSIINYIIFPISIILANGIEMISKKIIKNIVLFLFLFGCIFFSFFL